MVKRQLMVCCAAVLVCAGIARAQYPPPTTLGKASWYGEGHRGKLMANRQHFDPDKLTAASWFYPLGTRLQVSAAGHAVRRRTVIVTVTDRGPTRELVRAGRIIDLSRTAFCALADPKRGLVDVTVSPLK